MNDTTLESLADSLKRLADVAEKFYNALYPAKGAPKEPTVSFVKGPEEQLLEDQGQTGEETTEEWTTLGPIEREFVESHRKK